MGCNAWNHSKNCDCGWGGDTGYGWQNHGSSARAPSAPPPRPVIRLSTTIPNARCPVCGDVVFFYASPFGGRVFFDELGPPWPKHPCTDNPRKSVSLRSPLELKRQPTRDWQWNRDGWIRLTALEIRLDDGCAYLTAQGGEPPIQYQFGWEGEPHFTADDPVYCRRSPTATGEFELSYLPINTNKKFNGPETILVVPRASSASQIQKWREAREGDADAQNGIGMSLSYNRATDSSRSLDTVPEDVDWAAAEYWFRLSAKQGFWAGHHNLGVMHLRGDGVTKDDDLAFRHLSVAAESGEAPSLYRLADMFEHGIGTDPNSEEAARLRSMADMA